MAREWGDVIQDQFDASNALVHGAPSPDEAIAALHRLSAGYKERLDLAVDAAARYFDDAEKWREKYIAMRRERNEAMASGSNISPASCSSRLTSKPSTTTFVELAPSTSAGRWQTA